MKSLTYILTLLILFVGINSAQTKTKLTQSEAALKFEEFVIANGYTDLPPSEDKLKLVAESLEGDVDENTLRLRKNSLEQKPFEVTKGNRFSENGWTAIFLYKQPFQNGKNLSARVVYMDAYGENLKVEHQDIIIKKKR